MPDATFVAFVPAKLRARLRQTLASADTAPLIWAEKSLRRGSEFYFTGPPALVRRTHAYVTHWVANAL